MQEANRKYLDTLSILSIITTLLFSFLIYTAKSYINSVEAKLERFTIVDNIHADRILKLEADNTEIKRRLENLERINTRMDEKIDKIIDYLKK